MVQETTKPIARTTTEVKKNALFAMGDAVLAQTQGTFMLSPQE